MRRGPLGRAGKDVIDSDDSGPRWGRPGPPAASRGPLSEAQLRDLGLPPLPQLPHGFRLPDAPQPESRLPPGDDRSPDRHITPTAQCHISAVWTVTAPGRRVKAPSRHASTAFETGLAVVLLQNEPSVISASFLANAGEPLHSDSAEGEVDGAGDIHAAVGHFLNASGLEAFPDAADARQQAMTEELLGDLSLDNGNEPGSTSLQSQMTKSLSKRTT